MKRVAKEIVAWIVVTSLCILVAKGFLAAGRITQLAVGYFSLLSWVVFLVYKFLKYAIDFKL